MFAAVSSPWSANDEGEPLTILVEVADADEVPDKLGKAVAQEAAKAGTVCSEEDMDALLSTFTLID